MVAEAATEAASEGAVTVEVVSEVVTAEGSVVAIVVVVAAVEEEGQVVNLGGASSAFPAHISKLITIQDLFGTGSGDYNRLSSDGERSECSC